MEFFSNTFPFHLSKIENMLRSNMLHYARGKVFNYYKYLSLRELRGEITSLYTETTSASVLHNFCCLGSGDGVENELLLRRQI